MRHTTARHTAKRAVLSATGAGPLQGKAKKVGTGVSKPVLAGASAEAEESKSKKAVMEVAEPSPSGLVGGGGRGRTRVNHCRVRILAPLKAGGHGAALFQPHPAGRSAGRRGRLARPCGRREETEAETGHVQLYLEELAAGARSAEALKAVQNLEAEGPRCNGSRVRRGPALPPPRTSATRGAPGWRSSSQLGAEVSAPRSSGAPPQPASVSPSAHPKRRAKAPMGCVPARGHVARSVGAPLGGHHRCAGALVHPRPQPPSPSSSGTTRGTPSRNRPRGPHARRSTWPSIPGPRPPSRPSPRRLR